MKRLAALLLLLAVASPSMALDNARLVQHLRENLSLDTRTEIVVNGTPSPSGISDLQKVTVLVAGAPYEVLITPDGKRYIWGLAADLGTSPDAIRAESISLKNARAKGSAKAPVTVVEFSDLQCGFCRKAHEMLTEKLYTVYKPEQVRWVYKHYPLTTHDWAMSAAKVTECAARQSESNFWKLTDFYFKNQEKLTAADAREKGVAEAVRLGAKADALNVCIDDPKTAADIEAQKKEGSIAGVSSTPTIFVNGRLRRGFRDFEDIKVLIDEKLKAVKK